MDDLHMKGDNKLPAVHFYTNGNLIIYGRSISLGATSFYNKLLSFASQLDVSEVILTINLSHVNSESAKQIFNLITFIDKKPRVEKVTIQWHYDYDDEEILNLGKTIEEFTFFSNFNFFETVC